MLALTKLHLRRLHRIAVDGHNGRGPLKAMLNHGAELLPLTVEARNARTAREWIVTRIERANQAEAKYGKAGAYTLIAEREVLRKVLNMLDDGLERAE